MAMRDCIEAVSGGLRSYPQRLHCSLHYSTAPTLLAVRESEPESDSASDEIAEILGRLSDARSFLECGTNSLIHRDAGGFYSPEVVCLHHGLELLRTIYNKLDLLPFAILPSPRREGREHMPTRP